MGQDRGSLIKQNQRLWVQKQKKNRFYFFTSHQQPV